MNQSIEIEKVISNANSQLKKSDKAISDIVGITSYCSALMYDSADLVNNIDAEISRMTVMKESFISQINEYCDKLIETKNKILDISNNTKDGE